MGEAARNFTKALVDVGVQTSAEFVPNLSISNNLGNAYEVCRQNENRNIPYQVKIIHTTPDVVRQHMEPMKYHIFHLFWETDKLPRWWVWELNHSVDEIWTGSEWNKKVFQKSGIKLPIWVCPQPIPPVEEEYVPFSVPGHSGFLFTSIFQWIERKDPKTLLMAYWKEFSGEQGVSLLMKTYKERFTSQETNDIVEQIQQWKKELNLPHYPKTYLFLDPLSRKDLFRLYKTTDCVVSAHRGEGFGIPVGEAMAMGKPVISTDLGGIHEHIPKEYWYPVKYTMRNVFNMDFVPWYDSSQMWGQIDEDHLRKRMREVFSNQEEARKKGEKAQQFISKELSYENIGLKMKKKLEGIYV